MVTVPSQYQQYISQAAQGTGLPISVVAAQANEESGFNPFAVSPTNAQGFWQFEPYTYAQYAPQAGVPSNSEFNVAAETQVYIKYMNQLLRQEGGSVFKALEAYNAGPGNLQAGAGYANVILSNAGQNSGLNVSAANTTGIHIPNPLNLLNPVGDIQGIITGAAGDIIGKLGDNILHWLGVPSLKDLLQRLGLILLGAVLIIVGLTMIVKTQVVDVSKIVPPEAKAAAEIAL